MRTFASFRSCSRAALVALSALILFSFSISAIDATPEWNSIPAIMIGDSFGSLAEQPLFSTAQEVSAGAAFNVSIPLAGDDWQIDPTQAIEVRFMLMMVSGTVNYNSSSKKLKAAYFSDKVQGVTSPDEIESYNYTEYSYFCSFDPAVYETGGGVSGGLPTEFIVSSNGIYTGRGYFFDVVINANSFTGTTPKSIQFDVSKFTTQTGDSTIVFCPYVAVRNIIPTERDYLIEILQSIQDLQSNGGMSPEDMSAAMVAALEQHDEFVRSEAEQEGQDSVSDVTDEIENVLDQEGVLNVLENFATSFSHSGTTAILTIPDIYIPAIPGVFEKIDLLSGFDYDLTGAIEDVCPEVLLNALRVVMTCGVLYFPVKEIMSVIKSIFER